MVVLDVSCLQPFKVISTQIGVGTPLTEHMVEGQMTPRLKPGACGRTPPQLSIPLQACSFGFVVRHIRGN